MDLLSMGFFVVRKKRNTNKILKGDINLIFDLLIDVDKDKEIIIDDMVLTQVPDFPHYYVDLERGELYSYRTGDILKKLSMNKNKYTGYVQCSLMSDFGYRYVGVFHRVVMACKLGHWDFGGLEVDHINEDKDDNRIGNLRLTDRKGQYTKSVRERMSKAISKVKRGSGHHFTNLTEDDVIAMRKKFDKQETDKDKIELMKEFAERHELSFSAIHNICHRRSWTHI